MVMMIWFFAILFCISLLLLFVKKPVKNAQQAHWIFAVSAMIFGGGFFVCLAAHLINAPVAMMQRVTLTSRGQGAVKTYQVKDYQKYQQSYYDDDHDDSFLSSKVAVGKIISVVDVSGDQQYVCLQEDIHQEVVCSLAAKSLDLQVGAQGYIRTMIFSTGWRNNDGQREYRGTVEKSFFLSELEGQALLKTGWFKAYEGY